MPRKKDDDSLDLRAQEAAYLTARHKMSQAEIGKLYNNISQSQVSRWLAHAKEKGWLEIEPRFFPRDIAEERMEEIRRILEPQDIIKALHELKAQNGVQVRNVWVFDSGSTDPANINARLKRFGRAAAGALAELLSRADMVAVSFGSTLYWLIEGFAASQLRLQQEHSIQFVPIGGEPVGRDTTNDPLASFTSSRLADRLNEIVNAREGERFTLAGVRAFIPKRFKGKEAKVIRKYLESSGSYRKIFTDEEPAIAKVDSLLTSIGTSERPMGFCKEELLEDGEIAPQILKSLIIGDMSGVLIKKPDLTSHDDHKKVDELNQLWTGIKLEHIKRIAEDAANDISKPGNIVIAIARNKAQSLYQIIRQGLVNTLIIDKDLADALKREMGIKNS